MPPPEPGYIDASRHRLFCVFHPAEPGAAPRSPVLICSPWGWDEVASYRPRRAWAQRLAAAGHPTLRFDLPATGNSSGSPRDAGILAGWLDAVAGAIESLRGLTGAAEVTVLGLGLGGLLATEAIGRGAPVGQLITLAAPPSGRSFVRSARNFSRLQVWNKGAAGDAGQEEEGGLIEASGFVLSPATLAELEALEPTGLFGPLRRALLLSRSSSGARGPLAEAMEAAGVEVEADGVSGWSQMVLHPETARLAADAADTVDAWLARGEAASASEAAASLAPNRHETIELDASPAPITETVFPVEQSFGRSFGVLATPAEGEAAGLCVVFFNAGAVRQTGPNRMWLERARAWAARGVPVLRIDLEAIGEADGDPDGVPPGDEFFAPRFPEQAKVVLDALVANGLGPDFLLVGLCSGGYCAFRTACADPRVRAASLINPGALIWRTGIFTEREAHKVSRVFDRKWVGKLLRGEIERQKLRVMVESIGTRLGERLRHRRGAGSGWVRELEADLDRLQGERTALTIMFSGNEGMADELEAIDFRSGLGARPFVEWVELPGSDHTLRPLWAQAALRTALDEGLERELAARGWPRPLTTTSVSRLTNSD